MLNTFFNGSFSSYLDSVHKPGGNRDINIEPIDFQWLMSVQAPTQHSDVLKAPTFEKLSLPTIGMSKMGLFPNTSNKMHFINFGNESSARGGNREENDNPIVF